MEIILKKWSDYSLLNVPDNELDLLQGTVFTEFNITDNQREAIYSWVSFTYINDEIVLWDETEYNLSKKKQSLQNLTLEEIESFDWDFKDTNIWGKELWELLIDKFYSWNPYAELRDHRIFIEAIMWVLTPTQTTKLMENEKVVELLWKSNKVKTILTKF